MKINWKHLATTPGYISLKKAVVENFSKKKHRSKKESYQLFYYVINRAKHYAHHLNKSIEEVLNEWEEKRGHRWIIGYYPCDRHSSCFPKLNKKCATVRPVSLKEAYKKGYFKERDPVRRKKLRCALIVREQQNKSKRKGNKARWPLHRKKSQKFLKEYEKIEALKKASS